LARNPDALIARLASQVYGSAGAQVLDAMSRAAHDPQLISSPHAAATAAC
jgi:hypothetical protein